MSRCTFTNPGYPSVNRPGEFVVEPWTCVRENGHDGGHHKVGACSLVSLRKQGFDWPCELAAGHEGSCEPPIEAAFVARPLRSLDREELIGAAAMAFEAAISAGRDARALNARLDRHNRDMTNLAVAALDGVKSPHGNNHTATCWRKHPHCLAFALIGCCALDRALASLEADGRP